MNFEDRIQRRYRSRAGAERVVDRAVLSPTTHLAEPTSCGPLLERVLDQLDPIFAGELPQNTYVWGERGTGKSAILAALVHHLDRHPRPLGQLIRTTAGTHSPPVPELVYVDTHRTTSGFEFYATVLDRLTDEPAPQRGVGVEAVRAELDAVLAERPVVPIVDHLTASRHVTPERVATLFDRLAADVGWVGVGRSPPAALDWTPPATIEFTPYETSTLVDVLMTRADDALGQHALGHEHAQRLAEWADGDANDALAALFVAADAALRAESERIEDAHVTTGIADVPTQPVSLTRVFALSADCQSVLRELVALDPDRHPTVDAAAAAIADRDPIDLSTRTVRRFLRELATDGVLERTRGSGGNRGTPPELLEPRFSPILFKRLYDHTRSTGETTGTPQSDGPITATAPSRTESER